MARRKRIFARLREGASYDEIAAEEGVSRERIRQIVTEVLQKRAVDSGADHAKLQLDRLTPAMQLGAEAIAAGDVSAITPYLKVLDRLDRYQSVASANQVYDDEARKKLLDKINRIAANLGIDQDFAAAVQAHLKATGQIPDDKADATGSTDAGEPTDPVDAQQEGQSEAANWMSI
jgi:Sigma-70, region 4